ncbi:MAG: tRNA pseudouridine(38-40) synthase TruA [Parachlamydiaceae bacterium]|nr:tRNA pseudouridine(38-40) synthase TruA [Parachlamydiaceae bacterium]
MYCYKLTIAYDGTSFSGWQIQPNGPSIQQHIQDILNLLLHRTDVNIIGSGRTDAGVHAKGQVAHFKHPEPLDLERTLYSLNGLLPHDIRVINLEKTSDNFHAQRSAMGKEYHYYIHLDRVMDPMRRLYCWHLHRKLDLALLTRAAQCFVGTHDFTSFANEAHLGSASKDPIRTLRRLEIKSVDGGICLEFEGNGFLYKMVRNIVGTLVDVATHKLSIEDIPKIFVAKDRRQASSAAPPQGLFLMKVDYIED